MFSCVISKSFLVTGGGAALLYASKELENLHTANFDQKIGVQIIQNALKVQLIILLFFVFNGVFSYIKYDIFRDKVMLNNIGTPIKILSFEN